MILTAPLWRYRTLFMPFIKNFCFARVAIAGRSHGIPEVFLSVAFTTRSANGCICSLFRSANRVIVTYRHRGAAIAAPHIALISPKCVTRYGVDW